jgi:predicted glycosyltransferase
MKILFDIAHPANVHYFKNLIRRLLGNGHSVIITAKDKDLVYKLLDVYGFKYYKLGNNKKTLVSRLFFIAKSTLKILKIIKKSKPDILISMGTTYCAFSAFLYGIPYFAFDDTEHAKLNRILYLPFANKIFTPNSYKLNLGKKHHKFNAFMELFYLHPDIFKPNSKIKQKLRIKNNEPYAILRFISWDAFHDIGNKGISKRKRVEIINAVSKQMKVFVSVEGDLPSEFEKYRLKINAKDLHHALYYANFYIGEGATTASECSMLGTPAIYINPLSAGTLEKQEEFGLLWKVKNDYMTVKSIEKIIMDSRLKEKVSQRRLDLIKNMINPTEYFFRYLIDYDRR